MVLYTINAATGFGGIHQNETLRPIVRLYLD